MRKARSYSIYFWTFNLHALGRQSRVLIYFSIQKFNKTKVFKHAIDVQNNMNDVCRRDAPIVGIFDALKR